MSEWLKGIDESLFLFLNGIGHPPLDGFMWWMSNRYIWFPMYAILIFLLYRKYGQSFYKPLIALILVTVCTDQVAATLMKPFFERPRPCHIPELNSLVNLIGNCGGKYGFPSSHAANAFGLASFFFGLKRPKVSLFLILWASVVSYSRIYLGVHYPGDVLAGILVGIFFGFLGVSILKKKIKAG